MASQAYKILKNKDLTWVPGFKTRTLHLGLRKERVDTALLYASEGFEAWGVFTKNKFRSLSIDDSIKKINKSQKNSQRFYSLAVFSGNANAATGQHAKTSIKTLEESLKQTFGGEAYQQLLCFTGVIGREFPFESVNENLKQALSVKASGKDEPFYQGILTTDAFPKAFGTEVELSKGRKVRMAINAKGAGMIYPNMATMLSYLATDLSFSQESGQACLSDMTRGSFNRISVDGDTSTNDSFFLLSSAQSGVSYDKLSAKDKQIVNEALLALSKEAALAVVRDGEGASKIIEVLVEDAKTEKEADKIARKIGHSLLVKTAVYGKDPNYGRIFMALGNAGVPINPAKVSLHFGPVLLYDEEKVLMENIPKAEKYLSTQKQILIRLSVGRGQSESRFYASDLGYEYIRINAEYTT